MTLVTNTPNSDTIDTSWQLKQSYFNKFLGSFTLPKLPLSSSLQYQLARINRTNSYEEIIVVSLMIFEQFSSHGSARKSCKEGEQYFFICESTKSEIYRNTPKKAVIDVRSSR